MPTSLAVAHLYQQDDEVDRLERSSKPGGWRGLNRQEVMDSMYGRIDPSPEGEYPACVRFHSCRVG